MNISTIRYANAEQTSIIVNEELIVPWPCATWHNETIQEWLNVPNTIDPFQNLTEIKDAKKQEINEWRDIALVKPVVYNSNVFDADERSQNNVNSVLTSIQAGVTVADPIDWRTTDNITVQLTHVQLAELGGLMLSRVQAAYSHSWDLKAQVDAAVDEAAVDAIEWQGV